MSPRVERIGDATLYLGDCREMLAEMRAAGAIITDPPYGIGFTYSGHADAPHAYSGLMDSLPRIPRVVLQYPEEMMATLVPLWGAPSDTLAWVYNSNLPRQSRLWGFWDCWPDWSAVTQPPKNRVAKVADRPVRSYDWCEVDLVKGNALEKTAHPCQLPIALAERVVALAGFSSFCDPFMGSGTLGVAAVRAGVPFVGIEQDPAYFEIALQRIRSAEPTLFAEPKIAPRERVLFDGDAA